MSPRSKLNLKDNTIEVARRAASAIKRISAGESVDVTELDVPAEVANAIRLYATIDSHTDDELQFALAAAVTQNILRAMPIIMGLTTLLKPWTRHAEYVARTALIFQLLTPPDVELPFGKGFEGRLIKELVHEAVRRTEEALACGKGT